MNNKPFISELRVGLSQTPQMEIAYIMSGGCILLSLQWCSQIRCPVHSFIPAISIAPLQVLYYSEALPTTARMLYRSFTPKRIGNCRLKAIDSAKASPCPTVARGLTEYQKAETDWGQLSVRIAGGVWGVEPLPDLADLRTSGQNSTPEGVEFQPHHRILAEVGMLFDSHFLLMQFLKYLQRDDLNVITILIHISGVAMGVWGLNPHWLFGIFLMCIVKTK